MRSKSFLPSIVFGFVIASQLRAQQPLAGLEKFKPLPAPKTTHLILKEGDRLAICGDSITEQKMYSRIMEDYLTMCVPQLRITVRQFGWSGEKAPGFLARMTNDCLRFKPAIATTCYGMNDHLYKPYEDQIGKTYREKTAAIDEAFKANGVRVVQGSAGCVGKMPTWVKSANGTVEDLNLNLCTLRNIGIEVAEQEKASFADVFWPMLTAGVQAREKYGADYAISGKDGVHPGWAGHTVMAYAFLKAFGLDGEIGEFTVDLKSNKMKASKGHEVISAKDGEFQIKSSRYPFCACVPETNGSSSYPVCSGDDVTKDSSIRSGMTLIPFNRELNRFVLVAKNGKAGKYRVTWGSESKTFTSEQLANGINLAEEFPNNPFGDAFAKVDSAVAAKQAFETKQIKQTFRSPGAKIDMEGVAAETEKDRAPLADAIHNAFVPMTHTIKIVPE
jgi:lysophospholipase L1-like esterase